jgi:hypothetical protein
MCVSANVTNVPPLIVVRRRRHEMSSYDGSNGGLYVGLHPAVGCILLCLVNSLIFVNLFKPATDITSLLNVCSNYS